MRRHDREKPIPKWEQRNRRGPGAYHPNYKEAQLIELREEGDRLMYQKRELIRQIEEGNKAGENTDELEDKVASLEAEHESIERKIKKFYE